MFLDDELTRRSSSLLAQSPEDYEAVQPRSQAVPHQLSVLDSLVPSGWYPLMQVFENKHAKENYMDYSRMKDSLRLALEQLPMAACGISDGQISVGNGAWICEAETKLDFHGFASTMAVEAIPDDFWFHSVIRAVKQEAPLFSAKLNRFKCGSVALIVFCHHYLADASGLSELLILWGRLFRGEGIQSLPVDLRSQFRGVSSSHESPRELELELTRRKVLVRILAPLRKIKAIQAQFKSGGYVSVDDILTAAFWRAKARTLPRNKTTSIIRAFDLRSYLEPPLASNSFGNFIEMKLFGPFPPEHVTSISLQQACQLIRMTELAADVKRIQAEIKTTDPIPLEARIDPYTDLNVTNHSRFYSAVDFDDSPAIFSKVGAFLEGVVVTSPLFDGSFSCDLCIDKSQADLLVRDKELKRLGFRAFQLNQDMPDLRLSSRL